MLDVRYINQLHWEAELLTSEKQIELGVDLHVCFFGYVST